MKSAYLHYKVVTTLIVLLLLVPAFLFGQYKSTGIGVRGSYYSSGNQEMEFVSVEYDRYSVATDVGAGGSLFIFSRVSDHFLIEFTVGGLAQVNTEHKVYFDEEVEVFSAVPMLVGAKYDILPLNSRSNLRPYLSIGPGAYILSDVFVKTKFGVDHGYVRTSVRGGMHAGAGFNFFFTETFGLNFETKYHMVDFNPNHNRTGYEIGLGLVFMWGDYESTSHQVSFDMSH